MEELEFLVRSQGQQIPSSRPKSIDEGQPRITSERVAEYLYRLVAEYAERQNLGLKLYRPLPVAQRFHASRAENRLLVGSNRAGKTTVAEAEIAAIATGLDPYQKRPASNQIIGCVGKNETHLSDPMWKKLWWPGAFSIIQDAETGLWRSVRPDPNDPLHLDPSDLLRRKEWKPAPPLLPPHMVTKRAYLKKNLDIPKRVELSNGTIIMFAASGGQPWQGINLDVFAPDEEMENVKWIPEGLARLTEREGLFIASFTPQAATPEYFEMHQKVVEGVEGYDEFELLIEDNPYISDKAKRDFYNRLKHDPDELAVRYYGRWAILGRKVYPTYDARVHGVTPFDPPDNWMRVMAVDPGSVIQAAMLAAIPPPAEDEVDAQQPAEEVDDYAPPPKKQPTGTPTEIHFYGEVLHRAGTARTFAEACKSAMGNHAFEVFIIDKKAGDQTSMGRGNTVADHYSEEFARLGISSRRTRTGFFFGSPDVTARELSLKSWLEHGPNHPPTLKVHVDALPHFDAHMKNRYYKKSDPTKRETRTEHDLTDCAEYIAAFFDQGLYYHYSVPPKESEDDWAVRQFKDKKRRAARRSGGGVISLSADSGSVLR